MTGSNPATPLIGRVAVITGAGRGIGRAIAIALAQAGADVCAVSRTTAQVDEVAREIKAMARRSLAVSADVTDRDQVDELAAEVRADLGRIDILVNNVGGDAGRVEVVDSDIDRWLGVLERNLVSAFLVTRAFLPLMIESGGGKIINIGSALGHAPLSGEDAYCVAKAGLWMFTRQLATEVWRHGIEVNELVPGPVVTGATKDRFTLGEAPTFAPSERVKSPEEVAPLAVWLATQPEGGPTGQFFSLGRRPLA